MPNLCAVLFRPDMQPAHLCIKGQPKVPICFDPLDSLAQKLYWLVYQIRLAVFTKSTAGSLGDVTR
jgi:hypothetical protein